MASDERKRDQRSGLQSEGLSTEAAERLIRMQEEIEAYQKKVAEQAVIIDLLKKTPDIRRLSTRERIEWINRHYEKIGSKKKACKVMGISMSTYHYDPKKSRAQKEEEDADLRGKIEQVRVEFPRTGYRTLLHHLKRRGINIGETKLRRVLSQFELRQLRPKKMFVVTTDSNHDCLTHPNLIQK